MIWVYQLLGLLVLALLAFYGARGIRRWLDAPAWVDDGVCECEDCQ
jgi:hypothetical protein